MSRVSRWNSQLTARALDGLGAIPGITIYGPADAARRTSLVAFNLPGRDPVSVAEALDRAGVESRAGCHCATLAHHALGLTPPASCRLSFYLYNTPGDVDQAVAAVADIAAGHRRARHPGTASGPSRRGGRRPRCRSRPDRHDRSGYRLRAEKAPAGARPARHGVLPHLRHGGGRHHRRDRRRRRPGVHLAGGAVRHLLHPVRADQRRARRRDPRGGRRLCLGPPGVRPLRRRADLALLLGRDTDVARRLGGGGGDGRLAAVPRAAVAGRPVPVRGRVHRPGHGRGDHPAAARQVDSHQRRDRADRPADVLHPQRRPVRHAERGARHHRR